MPRNYLVPLVFALSALAAFLLVGCGSDQSDDSKTFVYGTTGYGVEMDDAGLNPHENYSGWSAVRYGVAETLFRFNDDMEPEPWLATSYSFTDSTHCVITLRDDVSFTSGRKMTATAVKECLDDLMVTHDRAPSDTKIKNVKANDKKNTITITTSEACPSLVNYLCDPYGAIIDMQAGVTADKNVSGTGPYKATAVSDTEITLEPNANYWNGTPKLDRVVVRSITDGDTLTSALQSGEIDASYGLPYASYELFGDESNYTVASCETSRTFFGQVNYESTVMQDSAVRKALAKGIDKDGFIKTLLNGRGEVASGPFLSNMEGALSSGESYDPEGAKKLLDEAGWKDTDGDGIREKNGQKLSIRWLTYPGRIELPLLAESAQSTLGELGFDVQVNSTANHTEIRKDTSAWDVYVSALVTAPTGDASYFFGASCLKGSSKNFGGYENEELEMLAKQLDTEFDSSKRASIVKKMQKILADDDGYFFVSHLTMGIVSKAGVTGIQPHPCDYYEITVDLDKN